MDIKMDKEKLKALAKELAKDIKTGSRHVYACASHQQVISLEILAQILYKNHLLDNKVR